MSKIINHVNNEPETDDSVSIGSSSKRFKEGHFVDGEFYNRLNIPVFSSHPDNPSDNIEGDIYYNSTDDNIYRYDGTQWIDSAGSSGTSGSSGSSGTSGSSGNSGTSGSSGSSGTSGSSGSSGTSGSSGSSGTSGSSGSSGTSGSSGSSGTSGSSGSSGTSGSSGSSGTSGSSGSSGTDGTSGSSGSSGTSGSSGSSGTSGSSGSSGTSGSSGSSGTSGSSGSSGTSGSSGSSGTSGSSGSSGTSGSSGSSGTSGSSGSSGTSGSSGSSGLLNLTNTVDHDGDLIVYDDPNGGEVITDSKAVINGNDADAFHFHKASNITVLDTADYYSGTDVEAALAEIGLTILAIVPPTPPSIADRGEPRSGSHITTATGSTSDITWDDGFTIGSGVTLYATVDGLIGDHSPVNTPIDHDEEFVADLDGGDRAGVVFTGVDMVGRLNWDIAQDSGSPNPAFTQYAFDEGSLTGTNNYLMMELNGVELNGSNILATILGTSNDSSVDFKGDSGAQDSTFSGTKSGFIVSEQQQILFPQGAPYASFYRDGTWKVDSSSQRRGWNYVRILHYINGSIAAASNYADWVVDHDNTQTTFGDPVINTYAPSGSTAYLSGVLYDYDGTAKYDVDIDAAFKNTYKTGSIVTFTETGGSISATNLGNSDGNPSKQVVIANQTFYISNIRFLNGSITARTSVQRTFNANETNNNTASSEGTLSGLLIDRYIVDKTNQTDLSEQFSAEGYRMHTGIILTNTNYGSGEKSSDYDWDSSENLISGDSDHDNGLLQHNGRLSYPKWTPTDTYIQVINGDFSAATNGPGAKPDYHLASGSRSYLRYFYVTTGKANFTFTILGNSGTTFVAKGAETGNAIALEMLVPDTTKDGGGTREWKDCVLGYTGEVNIGCRTSIPDTAVINTSTWVCTIGGSSTTSSNGVIVLRVTAADNWQKYLTKISVVAG